MTHSEEAYQTREEILESLKMLILQESKNVASFVIIGETLHNLYYRDKLLRNQKEFLAWTKESLGYSKSTTYEYIISYKVYSDIVAKLPPNFQPPMYQSHCQLLSKVPQEQLVDVWINVNQTAPNGVITTAVLENYLASKDLKMEKKSPRKVQKRRAAAARRGKRRLTKKYMDSEDESEKSEVSVDDQSSVTYPNNYNAVWPSSKAEPLQSSSEPLYQQNGFMSNVEAEIKPSSASVPQGILTPKRQTTRRQAFDYPTVSTPFNPQQIFELAQQVVTGHDFDKISNTSREFKAVLRETWYGRLFCDISSSKPFSTRPSTSTEPLTAFDGLEYQLETIFTRFANEEYTEGIFVIRAEFGADWFAPIMQYPICFLRQTDVQVMDSFVSYAVFYLGPHVVEFCNIFRKVGLIPGLNCWSHVNILSSPSTRIKDLEFNNEFIHDDIGDAPGNGSSLLLPKTAPMEDLSSAASVLCHMTSILDD